MYFCRRIMRMCVKYGLNLRKFGVSDRDIIKDYLRTNRNAFLPALGKSIGIFLMTGSMEIARTVYKAYMVHRHLIEVAINEY